jgi:hypothetical protein
MKKTYPIKTDLFRFITVRTPDHLTQKSKDKHFIFHPDLTKSYINSCPILQGGEDSDRIFNNYLNSFPSLKDYKQVREIQTKLYDFSSSLFRGKNTSIKVPTDQISEMQLTEEKQIEIFDQLFFQIISRQSKYVRQACIQMIIADYYIKNKEKTNSLEFDKLKIIVPNKVIQCFRPWFYRRCGELSGVNNLGIADFRKVEQQVCCYVPGEVSHIENILAREYKERHTRNLVRTELTIESTKEVEIENLSDVTTSIRNEISSEVESVINDNRSANFGGSLGVKTEYMEAEIIADAYADFANSNSSKNSNVNAKLYAEEVIRRALERIIQRTSEKRTSKIIKEFEENNKHGFDNRDGENHVTGIYRWIDIIYTNRLINYGKRLMIEFLIPQPAEFYKTAKSYKPPVKPPQNPANGKHPPKLLSDFGINDANSVTYENAQQAASYYGISLTKLPPEKQTIVQNFAPPIRHDRKTVSQTLSPIIVPPDYEADSIVGEYTYKYQANDWFDNRNAYCDFQAGSYTIKSDRDFTAFGTETKNKSINIIFSPKVEGQISTLLTYAGVQHCVGSYTVSIILNESVKTKWKEDNFKNLEIAYNQKKEEYDREIENQNEQNIAESNSKNTSTNPAFKRIIEQRELKRACIEMITKPYCRGQGKDFLSDIDDCDKYKIPQVVQNKVFEEYSEQVKFFEQAFDWSVMSYFFYPYYWADKCDWVNLFQSEDEDMVFQAFLQAGMARVVVPVRPEFNEAVMYYIETGDIWLGGDLVIETEDDLYLSITEEMHTIDGIVEDEWEIRVPTSLAIVQGKSAFLDEEGLPCCHDIENEDNKSKITGSSNILELLKP